MDGKPGSMGKPSPGYDIQVQINILPKNQRKGRNANHVNQL